MSVLLWQPSKARVEQSNLTAFIHAANQHFGAAVDDYASLRQWSVAAPSEFWKLVWEQTGIIGDGPGRVVVDDIHKMPGAQWFPEARLNFAENLLRRNDDGDALVFWGEEKVKRRLSFAQLHALVSRLQQALTAAGVGVGDRVAGYLRFANIPPDRRCLAA